MKCTPTTPTGMDPHVQYATKMIRRVDAWKKGKRALTNTTNSPKCLADAKMSVRYVWGDPNPPMKNRTKKPDVT